MTPHDCQVARNSDVVFTMLGMPSEVEDVVLGRSGLLRNLAPGSIVIDMSTSRPELARRIAGMSHDMSKCKFGLPSQDVAFQIGHTMLQLHCFPNLFFIMSAYVPQIMRVT